jgi:hypothetical protein
MEGGALSANVHAGYVRGQLSKAFERVASRRAPVAVRVDDEGVEVDTELPGAVDGGAVLPALLGVCLLVDMGEVCRCTVEVIMLQGETTLKSKAASRPLAKEVNCTSAGRCGFFLSGKRALSRVEESPPRLSCGG